MRVLSVLVIFVAAPAFSVLGSSLEQRRHWNATELDAYKQWWRNATGYPIHEPPWWHNSTRYSSLREYFSTLNSTRNPSHEIWAQRWNAIGHPGYYWKQRLNSTWNSSNTDWRLKWTPSEKANWIQHWISTLRNQSNNWRQRRDVSHLKPLASPQGYSPFTSWVRLPRWNSTGYSPFNNLPPRWGPSGQPGWEPRWNSSGHTPFNNGPSRWNSTDTTYPNWLPRWF